MPKNDREVFEFLTADPQTSREISYIAYAVFAHEKSEWMKHWQAKAGTPPSQSDIDNWISNLTDHQFRGMKSSAVDFFDEAARDYLAQEMKAAKEDALRNAIVSEVKAASSFWKHLGMALITAIVAPLLLGAIVALALIYDNWIPAVSDISKEIGEQTVPSGSGN